MVSLVEMLHELDDIKDFEEGLVDLIFRKAENKDEARGCRFIQVPFGKIKIEPYAFSGYEKLHYILLPYSMHFLGEFVFEGCANLKTLILHDSLILISLGFVDGCSNLNIMELPERFRTYINSFQYFDTSSNLKIKYIK